nr:hypothetical protein [Tanacetum cinerariifolium]
MVEELDNYHLKELRCSAQCLNTVEDFSRGAIRNLVAFVFLLLLIHKVAITLRSYGVVLSVSRRRGFQEVKENQEKDKNWIKTGQKGKRVEAEKSLKQLQ